jgi:exonuclease I
VASSAVQGVACIVKPKFVHSSTAQVVACIAKKKLADRKGPELVEFFQQMRTQRKSNENELAMHILSIVADSAKGNTDKDSTIYSLRYACCKEFHLC